MVITLILLLVPVILVIPNVPSVLVLQLALIAKQSTTYPVELVIAVLQIVTVALMVRLAIIAVLDIT